LIRPHEHRRRNREAETLGGFEIDDQLELRGPFASFEPASHPAPLGQAEQQVAIQLARAIGRDPQRTRRQLVRTDARKGRRLEVVDPVELGEPGIP
jgi:hypothetical protein